MKIVIECEPKPPAMDLIPFTPRQSDNESAPTNTCSKIELKKVPIRLADKQFISDGSMILREQHEISSKLPQIGEILNATATVEPEEMVTSSGNTRLKGIVKLMFYMKTLRILPQTAIKNLCSGMLNLPFHTMSSLIL